MERPPPMNAYQPGTVLTVGSHTAIVQKYISEGGFAHVYKVEISPKENGTSIACLKRVAVPDKVSLNTLRAEVDSMKRLAGHKHIVSYIDSHAARINNGPGYEVFVLMELCENKGLIDFMNTRLQNRLTEPEVLRIMGEVTEGVCNMHALNPPLVHRDIKIENVLISGNGDYKLCDFGSASPVLRPPRNADEFAILQNDVLKNTTPQYRSPEMIDLYRGLPIDEKADIWALGIFLYKLCYYTTPFEAKGEIAILHAKFEFPDRPHYSDRLKNLISVLLREDPRRRPNCYQTLEEVCRMRGIPVPIADYTKRAKNNIPQKTQQQSLSVPQSTQSLPQAINKPVTQKFQPIPSHYSTPDLSQQAYGSRQITAQTSKYSSSPEKLDPFKSAKDDFKAKSSSPPPKPPRPSHIASNMKNLNKSLGSLSLNNQGNGGAPPPKPPTMKPVVPAKPKYVDSIVQTDDIPSRPVSRNVSYHKRPQSMYVLPSQQQIRATSEGSTFGDTKHGSRHDRRDNNEDVNNLKKIITGLSGQSTTVELSPGENHINSNVDFLKNLQQQDSGRSWVQQNTGGSISSLRRISTGSKKRNSLITQFTGKFSRSHSRSSSRASSIHESAGIYPSNSGTSAKYRSSSESIEEELNEPDMAPKKLSRSSSIQRRVQSLLNRSNDPPIVKTAKGYGNTALEEGRSQNDVDSDGFKKPSLLKTKPPVPRRKAPPSTPPLSAQSTPSTATRTPKNKISLVDNTSPSTLKKAAPPPKPKKPSYLKATSPNHLNPQDSLARTLSNVSRISDVSIPDIDDLEKSFHERFPKAS